MRIYNFSLNLITSFFRLVLKYPRICSYALVLMISFFVISDWVIDDNENNTTNSKKSYSDTYSVSNRNEVILQGQNEQIWTLTSDFMLFVFFHELGHAFISNLGLPIVGREEDVADEFAAMTLIGFIETNPAYYKTIKNAMLGWYLMWERTVKNTNGNIEKLPYWSEHSFNLQRFYNIACLLYGSNPETYQSLADSTGLPKDRADVCVQEYQAKLYAWGILLAKHIIKPGMHIPNPRYVIDIHYAEVKTKHGYQLMQHFKRYNALRPMVNYLNNRYLLRGPVNITFQDCGTVNAFWSPSNSKLYLCYEMFEFSQQMFTQYIAPQKPSKKVPEQRQNTPSIYKKFTLRIKDITNINLTSGNPSWLSDIKKRLVNHIMWDFETDKIVLMSCKSCNMDVWPIIGSYSISDLNLTAEFDAKTGNDQALWVIEVDLSSNPMKGKVIANYGTINNPTPVAFIADVILVYK